MMAGERGSKMKGEGQMKDDRHGKTARGGERDER